MLDQPSISRSSDGLVTIQTTSPDLLITYTLDGKDPGFGSMRYAGPFDAQKGGMIKARAFVNKGKEQSDVAVAEYDDIPIRFIQVKTVTTGPG